MHQKHPPANVALSAMAGELINERMQHTIAAIGVFFTVFDSMVFQVLACTSMNSKIRNTSDRRFSIKFDIDCDYFKTSIAEARNIGQN